MGFFSKDISTMDNVGFDPLEDAKASAVPGVQPVNGRMLLRDLLDGKTARVMGGFRMVGNSEIPVASSARRLGHGVQRIDAIGQVCMGVQNVAAGESVRKVALALSVAPSSVVKW